MFAEERQFKIVELLKRGKSVKVKELCDKFDVSASTIRRDLQQLEEKKLLQRTHGGAVAKEGTKFEPSFVDKKKEHHQAKVEISRKATELINDGDTIIVDAGTTTTELAKSLDQHQDLTIVTNGINIALELAQSYHEVILAGGNLKKRTLAMVGPVAEENLRRFHTDKVFLGANGVDLKAGITTPDLVEANSKQVMVEMANEVIVLADHSKFEETAFIKVVDLEVVDKIITDKFLDKAVLNQLQNEVEVIVAGEVK